jgi:hypothetical protein
VRQNLYTCCRCGAEQRTPIEDDDAPVGWATVSYQCIEAVGESVEETQVKLLTTHACESCAVEVLAFLEKAASEDIDRAFDHGGDA